MEHRLDNRVEVPIYVAIHTERHDRYKTRISNLSTVVRRFKSIPIGILGIKMLFL